MGLASVCPLQRRLSGSGEEPRRHRGLQESDGRLVRDAGACRHVERLRVQRGGAASCGEGDGGLPQICECLNQGRARVSFCLFIFFRDILTLARSAARQAIRYENHALNAKYCLCQMLRDKVESPLGKQVQAAQTLAEIR